MTDQAPPGGWLANEQGKPYYGDDGWCRCCCDGCAPFGCSHKSNPVPCPAHPEARP